MILLLHNRYRVPGGEERAVEDLAWLIRTELGEEVEVLERDSAALGRGRAALGLLRGGLAPDEVAAAVRRTGARVVHAHNVQPSLGWRALAAARAAGARVVLHLHNYRLVCAVGTCFTRGEDCTRCHGRNTLPGVRLNCRGGSRAESAAYGAGLALWQRRLAGGADAFVVPSAFALRRLRAARRAARRPRARDPVGAARRSRTARAPATGSYALFAGRLAAEKGVADAIAACRAAGRAARRRGRRAAGGGAARARGRRATSASRAASTPAELAALRAGAALALVPVALRGDPAARRARGDGRGAAGGRRRAPAGWPRSCPRRASTRPATSPALAERIRALWRDAAAGEAALAVARERTRRPWSPPRCGVT